MNKNSWKTVQLGDCFEFIRNGANIKQYANALGIPITRIETLSNNKFNRNKLGYADIFDLEKHKKYLLEDGDILMSHINSTKYLGRAVLYSKLENETIIHGMNLLNLRAIKSIVKPRYIAYYFSSSKFKDQIAKITKKAVNQASFTVSALKEFPTLVAPINIQKQIVEELDTLSDIITKKKEQLAELDKLAQATFYDMFGDPVKNERNWSTKILNEIAPAIASKDNITPINNKYLLLNLDMIESDTGYITNYKYVSLSEIGNSTYKFDTTNLLYSKLRPYLNKVVNPTMSGYATTELVPLKPDIKYLNKVFLSSLLRSKSFVNYIKDKVTGTKMPRTDMNTFKNFSLIVPPLSLQNQFAKKIEAIEQQKALINQSITDTQLLFDYTMDKYFN